MPVARTIVGEGGVLFSKICICFVSYMKKDYVYNTIYYGVMSSQQKLYNSESNDIRYCL